MFKPQLILFWMEKPKRIPIAMLSVVLFMIGATMFGQASLDKNKEAEKQTQKTEQIIDNSSAPAVVETAKEVKQ
jgi:uncharacterized membrane protein YeiB